MFKKIKESTGLEWGELTSILVGLSVGLPFIYKVGFYNELGIGWYINTANAFTIFVSSIAVIFWGGAGLITGYLTFLEIIKIENTKLRTFIPVILNGFLSISLIFIIISKFFFEFKLWFVKFDMTGLMVALVIYSVFITLFLSNYEWKRRYPEDEDDLSYLKSGTVVLMLFAFLSWGYGQTDAKNVVEYRDQILNKVNLDDPKENWYLVDYTSDKALILKDGSEKVFKIVEYKDLKQISPPEQKQTK